MSVIVSGPRRVYVVLLFWERVGQGLDGLRALQPIERVMDARPLAGGPPALSTSAVPSWFCGCCVCSGVVWWG